MTIRQDPSEDEALLAEGGLELLRIDADHWLIHDHGFAPSDARHVVACIEESDDGMDVVWVSGGVPLPTRYRAVGDILEDLLRWRGTSQRYTRPVDIASFPPPPAKLGPAPVARGSASRHGVNGSPGPA